jgi:hypothetical protein
LRRAKERIAAIAAAALAGAAMSTFSLAAPASAADPVYNDLQPTSFAYTDSAHPGKSFTNPDWHTNLPVGTSATGSTSRVYATFDLSPYVGKHIVVAHFFSEYTSLANCSKTAAEVWQTATPERKITWDKAPAEVTKIGAPAFACDGAGLVSADLTAAVTSALAAGQTTFSLDIRVPAAHESDPAYAFTLYGYYGVKLDVGYNTPPTTPIDLRQNYKSCSTSVSTPDYVGTLQPNLAAATSDVDPNSQVQGDFAVWPVDQPDQRSTFNAIAGVDGRISANVPTGVLTDGGAYAWQVRADDGIDTSDWSQTCFFNVDATPPSAAPGVDSPNYPQGDQVDPAGAPMTFNLTPNGVSDIVAYSYGFFGASLAPMIPANSDGTATVTLNPQSAGLVEFDVRAFDRAGNVSPLTAYTFTLERTAPAVTSDNRALIGTPFHFSMTPNPDAPTPVDSYQFRVNDGDWTMVAADASGNASSSYTPQGPMTLQIDVRSHSANGWLSEPATISESVSSAPLVTSSDYPEFPADAAGGVGVPGTFVFTGGLPHAASFTYEFDYGADTTVDANSNGQATITYTPDTPDFHILTVYETTTDGSVSETYTYYFMVNE